MNSSDVSKGLCSKSSLKSFNSFDPTKEKEIASFLDEYTGKERFPLRGEENFIKIKKIFESLVNEIQMKSQIVTVAGTNGKGEVAHTLFYLLSFNKKAVALWTSPHILSIRERFSFLGEDISYSELESYIKKAKEKLDKDGILLSYYEFLFYVFLLKTKDLSVEFVILEVGLGGRLDAVNVFSADIVALTSISRDHEEILGHSYEKILIEKLGVLRSYKKLFSSLELKFCRNIVKERVRNLNIDWVDLFESGELSKNSSYFVRNQKLAFRIANVIISLKMSIEIPLFKGRREILAFKNLNIHFIGAHNLDGIRKMKHNITTLFDKVLISFSRRPLKDVLESLKIMLLSQDSKILLTAFDHDKAIGEKDLKDLSYHLKINDNFVFVDEWGKFLDRYIKEKETNKKENLLVTGSYYFIGQVQSYLYSKYFSEKT